MFYTKKKYYANISHNKDTYLNVLGSCLTYISSGISVYVVRSSPHIYIAYLIMIKTQNVKHNLRLVSEEAKHRQEK